MPTVIIFVGTPTCGKTTFANKLVKRGYTSVSRDAIRDLLFGTNYKQNPLDEKKVNRQQTYQIDCLIAQNKDVVLDNCHCSHKYIDEAIKPFKEAGYDIKIKFFDLIPLWKVIYRNIKRYVQTGHNFKFIPYKIIKRFRENYKKIDKSKYKEYDYV